MPETPTPQNQQGFQSRELGLLDYHRKNLRDGTYLADEDGYVTTVRTMGVTVDDKYYMIPSYVGGRILEPEEAVKNAESVGWENFPSYSTMEEFEDADKRLHTQIEDDFEDWQKSQGEKAWSPEVRAAAGELREQRRRRLVEELERGRAKRVPGEIKPTGFKEKVELSGTGLAVVSDPADVQESDRLQELQEQLESLDLYEEEQYDRLSLEREKVDFELQAQYDRIKMGQEPYTEEELEGLFEVYVRDRDVLKLNIVRENIGMPSLSPEAFEPAGFGESFAEEIYWPIMGTIDQADYIIDLYERADRIERGEGLPQDEKRLLEHWATLKELEIRGRTWMGEAGAISGMSLPFMMEIVATRGVTAGAKKALTKAGFKMGDKVIARALGKVINKATKGGAENLVKHLAKKRSGALALKGLAISGDVASAEAVRSSVLGFGTGKIYADAIREVLMVDVDMDQMGEIQLYVDAPTTIGGEAILRSWAKNYVEYVSERTGAILTKGVVPGVKKGLSKITPRQIDEAVKGLKTAVVTRWMKNNPRAKLSEFGKFLAQKGGYHGVLGEDFEEWVGSGMHYGIDAATMEDAELYIPSLDEWLQRLVGFGVPMGGQVAIGAAVTPLARRSASGAIDAARTEGRLRGVRRQQEGALRQEEQPPIISELQEEVEGIGGVVEGEAVTVARIRNKDGVIVGEVAASSEKAEEVEEHIKTRLAPEEYEELEVSMIPLAEIQAELEEQAETVEAEAAALAPRGDMAQTEAAEAAEALDAEIKNELDAVAETASNKFDDAHTITPTPVEEQDRGVQLISQAMGRAGVRVVPVDITAESGSPKIGGAQLPSRPDVVFVQDTSKITDPKEKRKAFVRNFLGILAHEATHTLESMNPALYNYLILRGRKETERGRRSYAGTEAGEVLDSNYESELSEGLATAIQKLIASGRISLDPTEKNMWNQLKDWLNGWVNRTGLRGSFAMETQKFVDRLLAGENIAEIELPGQRKELERARREGLLAAEGVTGRERAEAEAAPRFASALGKDLLKPEEGDMTPEELTKYEKIVAEEGEAAGDKYLDELSEKYGWLDNIKETPDPALHPYEKFLQKQKAAPRFAPALKGMTIDNVVNGVESEPGTVLNESISSNDLIQAMEVGVRFAPSGVLADVPRVPSSFFEGKEVFAFFADWMREGWYKGINPESGISIKLQGGPAFPHMVGHEGVVGWAFSDKGMVTRFNNKIAVTDGVGVVVLFKKENLMGNLTFLQGWIAEVEYNISVGVLDKKDAFKEINIIRNQALNKRDFGKKKSDVEWMKKWKKKWNTWEQVQDALASATFDARRYVFGYNDSKKGANKGTMVGSDARVEMGFPNLTEMVELMADPSFEGLEFGTIVSVVDFGKEPLVPSTAEEFGVERHLSYSVVVKGNGLGVLERTVNILDVYDPGKDTRARNLRSASISIPSLKGKKISAEMKRRKKKGQVSFAPAPDKRTKEERQEAARKGARLKAERRRQLRETPSLVSMRPELQAEAVKMREEEIREARSAGKREGRAAFVASLQKSRERLKKKKANEQEQLKEEKKYLKTYVNALLKGKPKSAVAKQKLLGKINEAKTITALNNMIDKVLEVHTEALWKDAVTTADSALAQVKKGKGNVGTNEEREELEKLIADVQEARGKRRTFKAEDKDRYEAERDQIEATEKLEEAVDALRSKYAELRKQKVNIEGMKKETVNTLAEAVIAEINIGRDPIKQRERLGKTKIDKKGGKKTRVIDWIINGHSDMSSLIQRIVGSVSRDKLMYRLFVDGFRKTENKYNDRLRDFLFDLDRFAVDAGYRDMQDMAIRLHGTHGNAMLDMLLDQEGNVARVELGKDKKGNTAFTELTMGEALHIYLLDPSTFVDVVNGAPLSLGRETGMNDFSDVTIDQIAGIVDMIPDNIKKLGDNWKKYLNEEVRPGMFAAHMRLKGYEPEAVEGYWPRQRLIKEQADQKIEQFLDGQSSFAGPMSSFLENSGQTKRRIQGSVQPVVINSALTIFMEAADTGMRISEMAEQVRVADGVMRKSGVKEALEDRWGPNVRKQIRQHILDSTGVRDLISNNTADKLANYIASNTATSLLAMNPRTWAVQISGIPRMFGTYFNAKEMTAGIAWMTANSGRLRSKLKDKSSFFWRRWARSSAERFGPEKVGQLVPLDTAGFVTGVVDTAQNLLSGSLKSAAKSWGTTMDSIKFLDGFDAIVCAVAYGAALSKAKSENKDASNAKIEEIAGEIASNAIRDTQNSTSSLDLSGWSVSAKQGWARYFIMFSSDPIKLLNVIAQSKREFSSGSKLKGSQMLAGVITSMLSATALRVGTIWGTGELIAALFGDDDDVKRGERMDELETRFYQSLFRELSGLTFFAPILDIAGGYITNEKRSAELFANPLSSLVDITFTRTTKLVESLAALGDDEADQVYETIIESSIKFANDLFAVGAGNPLRPIINDIMKYGPFKVNEPASHLRSIEKLYRQMIEDGRFNEMTEKQKKNLLLAVKFNKGTAKYTRAMSRYKKAMDLAKEQGNEKVYQSLLKEWTKLRDGRTRLAQIALGQIKDE